MLIVDVFYLEPKGYFFIWIVDTKTKIICPEIYIYFIYKVAETIDTAIDRGRDENTGCLPVAKAWYICMHI